MIYRVTMDLYFDDEDQANDFYHDGEVALPKSVVINPALPGQENGYIRLHQCEHELQPPLECTIIKEQIKY